MPFFSVIIPIHNNAETITDAINSVKQQLYADWQCVLVDDYSTDNTVSVVQDCIKNDDRFLYLINNRQKGANTCRNIGFDNSDGKYLIFLDGDDILLPDCLQNRTSALAKENMIDMLICPTIFFDTNLKKEIGVFRCVQDFSIDEMISAFIQHKILWTTTSPSWRKEFLLEIGAWNETYPRLQDIELNIRALRKKPKLLFLNLPDSHLQKSTYTEQKQKGTFIGLNLLLRDYYFEILDNLNDEQLIKLYQKGFTSLIKMLLTYWKKLRIDINDEWGQFFVETIKDIMEEGDFAKMERVLKSMKSVQGVKADLWNLEKEVFDFIERELKRGSYILELGSGEGTNKLLEDFKVISVEHDYKYIIKRGEDHIIYYAPLISDWYESEVVKTVLSKHEPDLIIIDGPPGVLRCGILNHLELFSTIDCPVLFDDVNRENDKNIMQTFCEKLSYQYQIVHGTNKSFAYCKRIKPGLTPTKMPENL